MTNQCPVCRHTSHQIHSHYQRTVSDLPWAKYRIVIALRVHKFFCRNQACERRIFTERLPELVAPGARRTQRLDEQLSEIALALGGAAGARLSRKLGCDVSRTTLLRLILQLPLPQLVTPKTLGVDDFSFRRRQTYGTLLVDLDQHRPIAILPGREAQTLASWLQQHPGVETLSRDRSKIYKRGMNEGAPGVTQVADRFHLMQNLASVLEQVLSSHSKDLKAAQVNYRLAQGQTQVPNACLIVPDEPPPDVAAQPSAHRQQRGALHQQVWKLYNQGWSSAAIAHQVGMSLRTVQRDLRKPNYAPVYPRGSGKRSIEAYKDYLQQRCASGQRPKGLMQELRQLGYRGSERSLQRALQQLRQAKVIAPKRLPLNQVFPKVVKPLLSSLTPSRLS
ncbi:ISL3 family transposase [Microcoleus sp. FACHB-1515]|nr:ISL3 family transposase [Microcoleus sp. FACHB-1515]